jgi:hypothetical protein
MKNWTGRRREMEKRRKACEKLTRRKNLPAHLYSHSVTLLEDVAPLGEYKNQIFIVLEILKKMKENKKNKK